MSVFSRTPAAPTTPRVQKNRSSLPVVCASDLVGPFLSFWVSVVHDTTTEDKEPALLVKTFPLRGKRRPDALDAVSSELVDRLRYECYAETLVLIVRMDGDVHQQGIS